jgi:hypothetical protein
MEKMLESFPEELCHPFVPPLPFLDLAPTVFQPFAMAIGHALEMDFSKAVFRVHTAILPLLLPG